jgi:hypothetical protein
MLAQTKFPYAAKNNSIKHFFAPVFILRISQTHAHQLTFIQPHYVPPNHRPLNLHNTTQ